MSVIQTEDSGKAKIENRREELERAAESDLPVAPVAEALLEVAKDGE
jgi:hypothetical protein